MADPAAPSPAIEQKDLTPEQKHLIREYVDNLEKSREDRDERRIKKWTTLGGLTGAVVITFGGALIYQSLAATLARSEAELAAAKANIPNLVSAELTKQRLPIEVLQTQRTALEESSKAIGRAEADRTLVDQTLAKSRATLEESRKTLREIDDAKQAVEAITGVFGALRTGQEVAKTEIVNALLNRPDFLDDLAKRTTRASLAEQSTLRTKVDGLVEVQMYQCPSTQELVSGGAWASFGCTGQLSTINVCTNAVWNQSLLEKKFNCTPIKIYRQN